LKFALNPEEEDEYEAITQIIGLDARLQQALRGLSATAKLSSHWFAA